MALPKQVKVGGTYYKGGTLIVNALTGPYVLDFAFTTSGAVNALTVIPSAFGSGDTIKLEHLDASNTVLKTLVEDIPNVGAKASWEFNFPALQKVLAGQKIRMTYTNAAGVAMTIYAALERIR